MAMQETIRAMAAAVIAFQATTCAADSNNYDLATNVYARTMAIYEAERIERGYDMERTFRGIKSGPICHEVSMTNFVPFCAFVSNRCDAILADWRTYETNDMVRYMTLCALGFSGFSNYTNFLSQTLLRYESNTNYCGWGTIKHLLNLRGTRAAYYLDLNYETREVGDMVRTIKQLAQGEGDTKTVNYCDRILSGNSKRECQDLIAIGDWIY